MQENLEDEFLTDPHERRRTLETRSRPKDVMRTSIITSGMSGNVIF